MKPNQKEFLGQVSTKKTASMGTTTVTAPVASTKAASLAPAPQTYSEMKLYNLCENVTIIGWMGIIASATMLLCSGLSIQFCNEIVRYFACLLRTSSEMERTRATLRRVVIMISTSAYFLSAVNVLMNMFLLFGVVKLKYKMLLPWILFHGFLFGLFAHLALYMTITSLLVDLRIFVILFASLTMILMIFYKISYEVFLLYKSLRSGSSMVEQQQVLNADERKNTYLILQSEA